MSRRVNPPHNYLTQDLANGKARLFAVEEVWDEHPSDCYENLRAVASLDWDHCLETCDFLNELMDEIDDEAERAEGKRLSQPGRDTQAAKHRGEVRSDAVQRLTAPPTNWSVRQIVGFAQHLPTAVATAVLSELARQGIDVPAVVRAESQDSTDTPIRVDE